MDTEVLIYDAFTKKAGMGNPAGVVLDAAGLTEERMQAIAAALGFNESAFVMTENGALQIRFFTPGHEVPLCGHATVCAMAALFEAGRIGAGETTITTGAGRLPVWVTGGENPRVKMTQCAYEERSFTGDTAALMHAIGLTEDDLDKELPVVYASTGLWTLLVPVKHLEAFERMQPRNAQFPEILKELPRASVHPFCRETYREDCHLHGRHFSSPFSGTVEDAVTGTASGAMGGYCKKHIGKGTVPQPVLCVEQGRETGRDGMVEVFVPEDDAAPVAICGTAVKRETRRLTI